MASCIQNRTENQCENFKLQARENFKLQAHQNLMEHEFYNSNL